jgi:hypothetical protein
MAYRKASKPITRKPSANRAKPKSKAKIGRGEMATVGRSKKPKPRPIGRRGVSKSGSKYGSKSGPKRRGK